MPGPESRGDIFWRGNEFKREELPDGTTAVYYNDNIMIQVYIFHPDGREVWDPHASLRASDERFNSGNRPTLDPRALIGLLAQ